MDKVKVPKNVSCFPCTCSPDAGPGEHCTALIIRCNARMSAIAKWRETGEWHPPVSISKDLIAPTTMFPDDKIRDAILSRMRSNIFIPKDVRETLLTALREKHDKSIRSMSPEPFEAWA